MKLERPAFLIPRLPRGWVWLFGMLMLAFASWLRADVLTFTTGERLTGTIVSENPLEVVFDSDQKGRLTVARDVIEKLETGPLPPEAATDAEAKDSPLDQLFESSLPLTAPRKHYTPIPLALPPSLPSSTNFVARVFWDDRLRYQLSTKVALPDPFVSGSTWIDDRLQLRGRIGAKLAVDAAAFASRDGQQEVPDGFQLRTFQVLTEGTVGVWLTNQYALELGLVDGEFYLSKAYWRLVQLPHFGDLTIGYFTVPQTLDNIMAFGSLTFMEPSAGTAAFSPGKRAGIEWNNTYLDQRMTAAAGIFSVGQDPSINFGNASQALAQPVIRFTGLPWEAEDRWLHVGFSYSFVFSDDSVIQYKARPESRQAPFLVNTGEIDARQATIGGLEFAMTLGPILLQSEFINSRLLDQDAQHSFYGGYFAGGWMITGETRPYNRATGIPTRVQPRHPLWGPNAGWGAFEAAGRVSFVDLDDGPIQGGRMRVLMTGLNWYWNQYIRLQFNYGFAEVDGGSSPGNLHILEARFEGQF